MAMCINWACGARFVEAALETGDELLAAVQQTLEGDLLRHHAVVEKQDEGADPTAAAQVGARGIDAVGNGRPLFLAEEPPALRLARAPGR